MYKTDSLMGHQMISLFKIINIPSSSSRRPHNFAGYLLLNGDKLGICWLQSRTDLKMSAIRFVK